MGTIDEAEDPIAGALALLKSPPADLLSPEERAAGFRFIGPYIDEKITPVPEHAYVRRHWIVSTEGFDMTKVHNALLFQLTYLIERFLLAQGVEDAADHFIAGTRLNSDQTGETRDEDLPDIVVLDQAAPGDFGSLPMGVIPVLAIEVMSESTQDNDLNRKRVRYRNLGILHYWVIAKSSDPSDGLERSRFFTLRGKGYVSRDAEFQEAWKLTCPDLWGLELDPEDVWVRDPARWGPARELHAERRADSYRDLLRQHGIEPPDDV